MKYLIFEILALLSLPAHAVDLDRARPETVGMSSGRSSSASQTILKSVGSIGATNITFFYGEPLAHSLICFTTLKVVNLTTLLENKQPCREQRGIT